VSVPVTLSDLERPDVRNQIFFRWILITLVRQPRHCICTNESRGLSLTAEFLVCYVESVSECSV